MINKRENCLSVSIMQVLLAESCQCDENDTHYAGFFGGEGDLMKMVIFLMLCFLMHGIISN